MDSAERANEGGKIMEEQISVCGRCFNLVKHIDLHEAPCSEKPELLVGTTQGMYHCPDCGIMVMACIEHPKICAECFAIMTGQDR